MRRALIRLYPADWRARYADEFEMVLEERPLGPFDVADIVLAAIDAHVRPRGPAAAGDHTRGVFMALRIGGFAAIVGGVLWLASLFGASVIQGPDGQPWQAMFMLALGALVVAMIGLSGEQGRDQPGLVWAAVAIPIVGAAISGLGMLGMAIVGDRPFLLGATPWEVWVLGTIAMIVGSGLFALASLRRGGVSRVGAALLVIGAVAALPLLFGLAYSNGPGDAGSIVALLGVGAFSVGWVWIGIGAIRTDHTLGQHQPIL